MVGAVLSAVNVPLDPLAGALFPAKSVAVPAPIEIPSVPSPVTPERVTVQAAPDPLTPTLALAVPVLFSSTFPGVRVLALKFKSL
jgi:hypothetical protein